MIYDLHTHTTASDGNLSPAELVDAAVAGSVNVMAITDHDTLAGYHSAATHNAGGDLRIIPGIEFSTRWRKIGVHVLGINVCPANKTIQAAEASQRRVRLERARLIARRLAKLSGPNLLDRVLEVAGDAQIGRPHFAQVLVGEGVVKDTKTAFTKYLGAGKPGDINSDWPDLTIAVQWINASGGIPVLAHPSKYRLTKTRLEALVKEFKAAGGTAIEVVSGVQDPATTQQLARLCVRHDLLASQGSDFHAPGKPWAALGRMSAMPTDLPSIYGALSPA